MAKTSDALTILGRLTGDDAELRRLIARESVNARVAQLIHDARSEAGLTQAQLAARVGTTQSVIARLEDADYAGHSLSMLQRVAAALGKRLTIGLQTSEPGRKKRAAARKPASEETSEEATGKGRK